jgi:hypothetical protein
LTLAAPSAAFADPFACYPVQRGDNISRLAKRITGSASNKYQSWFDVVDVEGRSVPKSQYGRVRAGWRACVLETRVEDGRLETGPGVANTEATAVKPDAGSPPTVEAPPAIQDSVRQSAVGRPVSLPALPVELWIAAAGLLPALGFLILGRHVRHRTSARVFMSQFAYRFLREFERPLRQYSEEPAIRAQLRVSAYRQRLDICLAPATGHRYPNLSDHRKNVEYDVNRVLSALADQAFVCGRLHMRGGWVVVPFRFSAELKQRDVRCISSL